MVDRKSIQLVQCQCHVSSKVFFWNWLKKTTKWYHLTWVHLENCCLCRVVVVMSVHNDLLDVLLCDVVIL